MMEEGVGFEELPERAEASGCGSNKLTVPVTLAAFLGMSASCAFVPSVIFSDFPDRASVGVAHPVYMNATMDTALSGERCNMITDGTCTIFPCSHFRGPTTCTNGRCTCKEGMCSNSRGICIDPLAPSCPKESGGTCRLWGCSGWRGPTQCVDGKCLCAGESCSTGFDGTCRLPGTCVKDTRGTCHFMGCKMTRGPTTCSSGKCVCQTGYCAENDGAGYGICQIKPHPGFLTKLAAVNQERPEFPAPHNNVHKALVFSGGGARALSNAMGAYRALEDLNLMQYVDAISSVSGGTWASSIYMFADRTKEDLLGAATKPEELTEEVLGKDPPAMGKAVTKSCHEFLTKVITGDLPSSQIWPLFIANTILKPFGLDSSSGFMAASDADVERIKRDNPNLQDMKFLVPRPGRPKVFVMGGTLLAPMGYSASPDNAVGLQMSPDYVGSPFWPDNGYVNYLPSKNGATEAATNIPVGGGMVEAFAFGSTPPSSRIGNEKVYVDSPELPFTLADAVGISSVAPAAGLAQAGKYQFVVPQANYWPVSKTPLGLKSVEYQLGDGGNLENQGLLPMIQRKAKKAAMWVSTYIPLSTKIDFCNVPADLDLEKVFADEKDLQVAPMVSDKFNYPYKDSGDFYTHNGVFAREDLLPVLCELQKLQRAGKPAVHKTSLKVLPNTWWGIQGGYTMEVVIVYLAQVRDFEARLPEETRAKLGPEFSADRTWKTSGEFARFPDYFTTKQTEEATEITRLTNREVNLLSAQSEYAVRENAAIFRDLLCPSGLFGLMCRQR
eukprot:TRINITY_DN9750_c0_g1_i4.p1 TRINITY_DN9750_c0_g1~~TRINITY_DN9750_c0_g1_i4.p1  ORF type:complete len:782 (+),score=138.87 TRINITY_DN9750_c0_g1_i4:62-2407(+)